MPQGLTNEEVLQIVNEMAEGVYDDYELPDSRLADIVQLSHACLALRVPFTWTPRIKGSVVHWQLHLVSQDGIGFTAPWTLVPASDTYVTEGGKHGW